MDSVLDAFKRNSDGSWSCVRAVTLEGPSGRIQVTTGATFSPGNLFMGVDLARYLEAHAKSGTFPAG
jgi:hypothetical protein